MIIVNLTPNSFSDGGIFNEKTSLESKLFEIFEQNISYIDVGAESTAPMNSSISEIEELERWELFFSFLKKNLFRGILSVDTVKPEVIRQVAQKFSGELIWNDVSGRVDEQVFEVLEKYPSVKYVAGHTFCPSREKIHSHMSFLTTKNITKSLITHFEKIIEKFQKKNWINRLILDPCFGFSKSREQNIELLKNFPLLANHFSNELPWVVGISRKSFLREGKQWQASEPLHCALLAHLAIALPNHHLILRIHDFDIYKNVEKADAFFQK